MFRNIVKTLVVLVLVLVAVFALSTTAMASTTVEEVLALVNAQRAAAGLAPVSLNVNLSSVAAIRAQESSESFSHTRPDGQEWNTAYAEAGVKSNYRGENLAFGQETAEEVVAAWMNSPDHAKNILNGKFTEMGLEVYVDEDGTVYWAQMFSGSSKTSTSNNTSSNKGNSTNESAPVSNNTSNGEAASQSKDAPVIDTGATTRRAAAAPSLSTNPGL